MIGASLQDMLIVKAENAWGYRPPSAAVARLFGSGGSGGVVAAPTPIYASVNHAPAEAPSAVMIGAAVVGLAAIGAVIYKLKKKRRK